MRWIVIASLIGVLSACASSRPNDKWVQFAPEAQALASARGQCQAQAKGALPGADQDQIMASCMYSKGWMH